MFGSLGLALLKQAAHTGYPAALSELGYIHQFGFRGASVDKQKTFQLLSRAAEAKLAEGQDRCCRVDSHMNVFFIFQLIS